MAKKRRNRGGSEPSPRLSKQDLRATASRQRRNQNIMVYGADTLLVALVLFLLYLNLRGRAPIGDELILPTQGNQHIPQDSASPISYNSTPPTSGPHYPGLAAWNIYRQPIRYEQVIHNLEDGGIVIYYQCESGCPELVEQLEALVTPYLTQGRHVVLMPNDPTFTANGTTPVHLDMNARIALTAWQRIDKFDEFDAERVHNFIEHYEGIDNHVAGTG